jgi:hypothetical protein
MTSSLLERDPYLFCNEVIDAAQCIPWQIRPGARIRERTCTQACLPSLPQNLKVQVPPHTRTRLHELAILRDNVALHDVTALYMVQLLVAIGTCAPSLELRSHSGIAL